MGWAYCPTNLAKILEKIRPAFNVNSYAQKIGNIVLDDKSYLDKSVKHNLYWVKWLSEQFSKLGIKVIPSVANFLTIVFKNPKIASSFSNSLEKKNIFVRKLDAYKMQNCIRITIGTESQNRTLLKFAKKILKEIK